jgi:hypothetical protein
MKARRLALGLIAGLLAAAVAGGAYAATRLSSNVISACVHRAGGGLYLARTCAPRDRRLTWNATGPAGVPGSPGAQGPPGVPGPSGLPGPAGAPGASAGTLFAQVNFDGTLAAASPGIRVDKVGLGHYEVDFGRDITRCVASVQQGGIPAGPGGSTGVGDGAAHANIFGAGASFSDGFPTGATALVSTVDHGGLSDSSFQIAILC